MAEPERKKIPDVVDGRFVWIINWISKITCEISLFVDPLFFYVLKIDDKDKCLDENETLRDVVSRLRSILDFIYLLSIAPYVFEPYLRRLPKTYRSLSVPIAIASVFPLPQLVGGLGILVGDPLTIGTMEVSIFIMFFPRIVRMIIVNRDLRSKTPLPKTSWPATANSIYYCMLASHVVGSYWYTLSVDSVLRCWQEELLNTDQTLDVQRYLVCPNTRYLSPPMVSQLDSYCAIDDPNATFPYGIFIGALKSGVLKSSTDVPTKLLYCFWWGLRNLSTFGQNLDTSLDHGEILFAIGICICSSILFTLLLGNIQNYYQSIRKKRKDAEIERYDIEMWMSLQKLPECLRGKIRRHGRYKWEETKFVDEETVLHNLPKEIRRDVKRHLCLDLLEKVTEFKTRMDSYSLDALCDRMKPVLYIEKTEILREDEPVEEMVFIKKGNLEIMAKDGPSPGFFKSSKLRDGDFCGEELVTWALDFNTSSHALPVSTRTVETVSEVEAYALLADDLKFIASQLHTRQLYQRSRLHDEVFRTGAACKIQKAWFRHRRKKMERSTLLAAEATPQSAPDMAVGTSSLALANYATNGLPSVWEGESSNISTA